MNVPAGARSRRDGRNRSIDFVEFNLHVFLLLGLLPAPGLLEREVLVDVHDDGVLRVGLLVGLHVVAVQLGQLLSQVHLGVLGQDYYIVFFHVQRLVLLRRFLHFELLAWVVLAVLVVDGGFIDDLMVDAFRLLQVGAERRGVDLLVEPCGRGLALLAEVVLLHFLQELVELLRVFFV